MQERNEEIEVLSKIAGIAVPVVTVAALADVGVSAYFYRRTMTRNNAKTDRTIKMAGTDWNQHMDFIGKRKEDMLAQFHEDWWNLSDDGLKLHATWFPQGEQKKIVICFHGYTSEGMKDYIGLSGYYLKNGYSKNYGSNEISDAKVSSIVVFVIVSVIMFFMRDILLVTTYGNKFWGCWPLVIPMIFMIMSMTFDFNLHQDMKNDIKNGKDTYKILGLNPKENSPT